MLRAFFFLYLYVIKKTTPLIQSSGLLADSPNYTRASVFTEAFLFLKSLLNEGIFLIIDLGQGYCVDSVCCSGTVKLNLNSS